MKPFLPLALLASAPSVHAVVIIEPTRTLSGDNGLAAVPEPVGFAVLSGLALAGFALSRRRKA